MRSINPRFTYLLTRKKWQTERKKEWEYEKRGKWKKSKWEGKKDDATSPQ